jgi:hypothetical protein
LAGIEPPAAFQCEQTGKAATRLMAAQAPLQCGDGLAVDRGKAPNIQDKSMN